MKKSELQQTIKEEIIQQIKLNEQKNNLKQILEKGNKINKAFSQHLDKYITQYNETGNVKL
jgi:flagellar motor switch protein FliM